jgi:primosomal protein N' (replication factor Y)
MPTYLEIAVNVPQISDVFHYHLPPELEGRVAVGHLVIVPFGHQTVQGVVMRFVDQPAVPETRPVSELVDPQAVLTPAQIEFAQLLAKRTLAPLSACVSLMLPPGLSRHADTLYSRSDTAPSGPKLTDLQSRLLSLLEKRGPLRGAQIDRAIPRTNWRASARALVKRGILESQSILPEPNVQPKYVRTAQLACAPQEAESALPQVGRQGTQALKRRQKILRFLLDEPGPVNVSWIYAESGGHLRDLRYLAKRDLVRLGESEVWRNPLEDYEFQPKQVPALTGDQEQAWEPVQAALQRTLAGTPQPPILLHGVTGSGKTEIYLRAVELTLQQERQAIVLVPEIALTPQTVRRFLARFPGQVGLLHSGLSQGERYDTWRRARTGKLSVMVGPRSALFTPFPNLGLIVVDESHDDSYFQFDPAPYYHAREAAILYARLTKAVCLLGSATPDVTSTYRASQGKWRYLHLPARIMAHRETVQAQLARIRKTQASPSGSSPEKRLPPVSRYRPLEGVAEFIDLPPTEIVDMRSELRAGNRSIFSRALQSKLQQVLDQDQQAILFLNRRGSATYVFCRDCGYSLECPRCDLPLTYHGPAAALRCHRCGYERKMPAKCPNCGSPRIRQYGTGTTKVEQEVQALFPQARTVRWDYETTRQKGAHEVILGHFTSQRANVLVGTQMLAKGLDLPLVTLVGVVLADVGLNLPDYRAAERSFQVLTQVAGRAGRSPLGGQVILQTFKPEHYAIQAAAKHNYRAFYLRELDHRRDLGYPPYSRLVRLEYRHRRASQAEKATQKMAVQLRGWLAESGRRATEIVGPVPCFFARIAGLYRWQIVLRGPDPAAVLRGRELSNWRVEVDPPNLL